MTLRTDIFLYTEKLSYTNTLCDYTIVLCDYTNTLEYLFKWSKLKT